MSKQKRYVVVADVTSVEGSQGFSVMAASEEEAIEKFERGEYIDIVEEFLEVQSLDMGNLYAEQREN